VTVSANLLWNLIHRIVFLTFEHDQSPIGTSAFLPPSKHSSDQTVASLSWLAASVAASATNL
jgi:hypothetical protein